MPRAKLLCADEAGADHLTPCAVRLAQVEVLAVAMISPKPEVQAEILQYELLKNINDHRPSGKFGAMGSAEWNLAR